MVREIFIGSMIHADENGEVIFKDNVGIFVKDGKIIDVMKNPTINQQKIHDFHADQVNNLSPGQFIVPGFIDCHTHAVQFPNLGLGYDKTLLDWLETYTFPLERQYTDKNFAEQAFEIVIKRTIRTGTTTACYFASLYNEASTILAQKCSEFGQRAFVGKVNMNTPRNDGYYESTEKSIETTKAFVEAVERIGDLLVRPIITPRFALKCDMELMRELARIAKEKDLHIQSHISEVKAQTKRVKEIFGEITCAAVYETVGLLTNKTILAHGIYLEDSELRILEKRGTAIIHCPSSNINLKSGLCDVRRLKANNIDVGLGTDVSGSNYSMLDEMRSVLHVSNSLALTGHDYVPLDYKDVFSMATLGGAKALSIEDKVGNLVPGKEFDALIIDLNAENSLLDNFREYTLEEKLQRFIYSGNDHNIVSVYVKGRKVK